jgi:hypothetical protein
LVNQNVPSLAELIRQHRDRTGDSYADMAARAERATRGAKDSAGLTRAAFQRLATVGTDRFPNPATLGTLAQVLDVPVSTIVLAAATSLGLPVQADTEAMWLPGGTEHLTPEDRAAVRAVTRALVDARTPPPTSPITEPGPITEPEPAAQHDYTLAARRGVSEGRAARQRQDDDAESP